MNTRLKQFIAAENITQAQFADTIKVVRASVSHVMSGRNNPGYDFIKAIMTYYPNLSIEWLMLGKGRMYKEIQVETHQSAPAQHYQEPEGNLFYHGGDDSPLENDVTLATMQNSVYSNDIEKKNRAQEQTFPINNNNESPANQRKVSKIIIFFDDGSYQEMQ